MFGFGKKISGVLYLTAVMMPVYAFAESSSAHEEHASGGLPQLNPESYASQIFWLLLCFGLLYYIMSEYILPQMAGILEKREGLISGDLERAETLRSEAEKTKRAYETALFQAEAQAASFVNESCKQLAEEAHVKISTAAETIHSSFDKAAAKLNEEKIKATQEILESSQDFANEIVFLLSGKKTR